jgi:hypothetical protein
MHTSETLSQFSTIDALMQGIYDGPTSPTMMRRPSAKWSSSTTLLCL